MNGKIINQHTKLNKMQNTFILMPIFKDNPKLNSYLGSIVNWGIVENGAITYETQEGVKVENIKEIPNCFILKTQTELNLKDSLSRWIKRDNYINSGKDFIFDDTITEGEVYDQYTWRVKVMIKVDEDKVKCKLILN